MRPRSSTELPRDFCAGIGPMQLGVVLVPFLYSLDLEIGCPNFKVPHFEISEIITNNQISFQNLGKSMLCIFLSFIQGEASFPMDFHVWHLSCDQKVEELSD